MSSHDHSANFVPAPQDEPPSKRQRFADDPGSSFKRPDDKLLEGMKQFWRSLWQDRQDPFHDVTVYRGSDPIDTVDVPATMTVLRLPKILSSIGDVMIRSDYKEAIEDFDKESHRKMNRVIIVGHPGIGRTMGSVGQAGYSYLRPLSRQDHLVILYTGQTSSRSKTNHPSDA
jgi:hypothetical protein